MPKLKKAIHYKYPNIGYFSSLDKYFVHAFSWGKNSRNMQFSLGDPVEVRINVQTFLDKLDMGKINDSINMIPEHDDRIMNIDQSTYESLRSHRFGRNIRCDAVFTDLPNVTLTTKPGDCTTAVVFCRRKNVVGIVHTGRRGVEISLPRKAIQYLTNHYGCHVKEIYLGIVPHLFQENRPFKNIDDLDEKVWREFVKRKNGYYYPAETEFAIKQYLDSGINDNNFFVYDVDTYKSAAQGETFSYKYHLEMRKQGKAVPEGRFIVAVKRRGHLKD